MWENAPLLQYMFNKIHNHLLVFDAIVASVTVPWHRYLLVWHAHEQGTALIEVVISKYVTLVDMFITDQTDSTYVYHINGFWLTLMFSGVFLC